MPVDGYGGEGESVTKTFATDSYRPILLKKSAVVFKAEKYASEIEILDVRRAFQAEISRRSLLKRSFHLPIPQ